MVACPECGGEIEAGNVEVGEIVVCPECGVELEVTGVDPCRSHWRRKRARTGASSDELQAIKPSSYEQMRSMALPEQAEDR